MTAPDKQQIAAFIDAAGSGNVDGIRQFIATHGREYVDVTRGEPIGWTALFWAARANKTESVSALLDAGAAIDRRDFGGATPLIQAAGLNRTEAVRLLLDRGADIDAADKENRDALAFAREKSAGAVVKLLEVEILKRKNAWRDTMGVFRTGTTHPIARKAVKFKPN